jgi:hypothetical protein
MVAYAFNPGTWEAEFEASLVYRVNSRTARATQRNPVSKKKKKDLTEVLKVSTGVTDSAPFTWRIAWARRSETASVISLPVFSIFSHSFFS